MKLSARVLVRTKANPPRMVRLVLLTESSDLPVVVQGDARHYAKKDRQRCASLESAQRNEKPMPRP